MDSSTWRRMALASSGKLVSDGVSKTSVVKANLVGHDESPPNICQVRIHVVQFFIFIVGTQDGRWRDGG